MCCICAFAARGVHLQLEVGLDRLVVFLQVAAGCFACPAQSTVQVIERFGKVSHQPVSTEGVHCAMAELSCFISFAPVC